MDKKLGEKIMTEFVTLRVKMFAYAKLDKELEEKHYKNTKNCIVFKNLTFDDYKTCLFDRQKNIQRADAT